MTLLILLYSFLISVNADAKEPTGRWLVEVSSTEAKCLDNWWMAMKFDNSRYLKKKLPVGNWHVIEIPWASKDALEKLPCVIQVLEDRRIKPRDTKPNDPSYINQADMELIGMPKAWDIATGGVTARGDTIVIAVIDFGFQPDHVDLAGNIWINRQEIPDDNIDNDGNGYTDDVVGVNLETGNDEHLPGIHHGTAVAGIIGAKGNNSIGIAGINWDAKLMLISGYEFESELIEAYEYVYQMRRKYRLSAGTEGAFVVATNLSGGIDTAFAEDHPAWCNMYDKLGQEGILNVAAGPNHSYSVDIEGDMPTTCTSDYLIAVTNVDLTDELVGNAGYGAISIDMGAPGHGTITTTGNNLYKEFPGTSSAAPHVTGTIALMYDAACDTFLHILETDPATLARTIKDIILTTGKNNNSLQGLTVTGKRLQTDAAVRKTTELCRSNVTPGVRILSVRPNPPVSDLVQVYFEVVGDTSTAIFDLFSANGSLINSYPISSQEFQQGYLSFRTLPLVSGVYFISLRNKKEKAVAGFFVR